MKNRYNDEYWYEPVGENQYRVAGDLKYWRFGGKEGQHEIDMCDLGFADPSGGPFIQVGMQLMGRNITRISAGGDLDGSPNVLVEVE